MPKKMEEDFEFPEDFDDEALDDPVGDGDTELNLSGFDDEPGDEPVDVEIAAPPPPAKRRAAATAPSKKGAPAPAAPAPLNPTKKVTELAADVPVQLAAVLAKKTMTLHDLLQLSGGQVIELGQPVSTTVDLVANGKLVARGELIEIDGQLGVKVVQIIK